ncbi:MAG: NAD-binding protein [Thiogranum sp.]|nr:NAD-binding protein [Thiogranum sp.]
MNNVIYLMLRRMRLPLILLVLTYAVSILGLTLIPGADDQGNPWRMDFFHAIYFVSFLGSTIGFGEIPYPFTGAQRMWTTFVIYAAVISWLYAIGSLLTLIQDPGLRRVLALSAFTRQVRSLPKQFFIVCGYGDAGSWLVHELTERGMYCVVVDQDRDNILSLEVEDLHTDVPGLQGDATESGTLISAGLKHHLCRGVICLTGSDDSNLEIAITSKLLAPEVAVFCQSDYSDSAANMLSFGTDHIIDPFGIFASRFSLMFHAPSMYLVYEWMTAVHNAPLSELKTPPPGTWVLCGYGRFGKSVHEHLALKGIKTRLIEADVQATTAPEGTIAGRGTEAGTLLEADIQFAAGVIAGTDDDANNLSILITARDLNPNLFTVGRQNLRSKDEIFKAARIDLTMQPSVITAQQILSLILAPLLDDFLRLASEQTEEWANLLVSRVAGVVEDVAPTLWELEVSPLHMPTVFDCLIRSEEVRIEHLCADPRNRPDRLPVVPLLLKRDTGNLLLPAIDTQLRGGDQLLLCGREEARAHVDHIMHDHRALHYTRTGIDRPSGTMWRWLMRGRT